MHARLTPRSVAVAFELDTQEVTADQLVIHASNEPADDLIDWLSRIHRWTAAEQSLSYLTMLKMLDDENSARLGLPRFDGQVDYAAFRRGAW
jgi:hypothetical protein